MATRLTSYVWYKTTTGQNTFITKNSRVVYPRLASHMSCPSNFHMDFHMDILMGRLFERGLYTNGAFITKIKIFALRISVKILRISVKYSK